MCLILATYCLTPDHIDHVLKGWKANPDGAGLAQYNEKDGLAIKKGFMDKASFKKALQACLFDTVIAHIRNATHGQLNEEDTHPFHICGGSAVMAHNGILPAPWSSCRAISDSRMFADTLYRLDLRDIFRDKLFIEHTIGANNKVAILTDGGLILILNEKSGSYWPGGEYTWISRKAQQLQTSMAL